MKKELGLDKVPWIKNIYKKVKNWIENSLSRLGLFVVDSSIYAKDFVRSSMTNFVPSSIRNFTKSQSEQTR
jgi:hypothetical protein